MNTIKNIYYDIAMLGKLILILPYANETEFKLINDSNIDNKLKELGLDCVNDYDIDPCPLETLRAPSPPSFDDTPTMTITRFCAPDPEWFKLVAKHHSKPHLRLLLDILLSPVLPRSLHANNFDFSENKYSEKLSESFEILLNNETARSYINSIIEKQKNDDIPLPLNPILTLIEMEDNTEELALYLNSLKQLVLGNRPSIRKLQISLIKKISMGHYTNTPLLD